MKMTTKAQSSKGIQLAVQDPTTGNLLYFNEVKSTPEIGESAERIDVTHLGSEIHEYIRDIPDVAGGDLQFTMNCQPFLDSPTTDDESNMNLIQSLDKSKAYTWYIMYPQLNQTVTVLADFTFSMGAGAISSAIELNLTLIPRAAPVFSAYTQACTITFAKGGASGDDMESLIYAPNTVVPFPECTFTYEGYTFTGWSYSGGLLTEGESFTITQNETLTATWAANTE